MAPCPPARRQVDLRVLKSRLGLGFQFCCARLLLPSAFCHRPLSCRCAPESRLSQRRRESVARRPLPAARSSCPGPGACLPCLSGRAWRICCWTPLSCRRISPPPPSALRRRHGHLHHVPPHLPRGPPPGHCAHDRPAPALQPHPQRRDRGPPPLHTHQGLGLRPHPVHWPLALPVQHAGVRRAPPARRAAAQGRLLARRPARPRLRHGPVAAPARRRRRAALAPARHRHPPRHDRPRLRSVPRPRRRARRPAGPRAGPPPLGHGLALRRRRSARRLRRRAQGPRRPLLHRPRLKLLAHVSLAAADRDRRPSRLHAEAWHHRRPHLRPPDRPQGRRPRPGLLMPPRPRISVLLRTARPALRRRRLRLPRVPCAALALHLLRVLGLHLRLRGRALFRHFVARLDRLLLAPLADRRPARLSAQPKDLPAALGHCRRAHANALARRGRFPVQDHRRLARLRRRCLCGALRRSPVKVDGRHMCPASLYYIKKKNRCPGRMDSMEKQASSMRRRWRFCFPAHRKQL